MHHGSEAARGEYCVWDLHSTDRAASARGGLCKPLSKDTCARLRLGLDYALCGTRKEITTLVVRWINMRPLVKRQTPTGNGGIHKYTR